MHQKPPGHPPNPPDRQHPNARLSVVNHCVTRQPGGVCRAATRNGIPLLDPRDIRASGADPAALGTASAQALKAGEKRHLRAARPPANPELRSGDNDERD